MIDVLAYELKYKNDPMVLELLKAWQEAVARPDGGDDEFDY